MPGACIDTRPILHSHRQDTEPSRTTSRYHNWRTMLHGPCLCSRRSDLPVWWRSSSGLFQCPQQRGSSIWSKDVMDQTKVRNLGSGLPSSSLTVDGEIVEGVEEFVYLGSKQASDGYCRLEIKWCIGLASAVMSSLRKVWNNCQLCVDTKVHVYCALVQSVLLYGSQIWTLLASDIKKLEAFHLRCKDYFVSAGGTTSLMRRYANKQNWRHSQNSYREGVHHYLVISLDLTQLSLHINITKISTGRNPGTSWKRLHGRSKKTWTSHIPYDTGMSSRTCCDASIRRGHRRGMLRSLKTTRWWWWWW